jgi:hypothetical protein
MIALEFPFTRDGFTHELLERDGLVCLVKRSKPAHWHYEVVKLSVQPAHEFMGKQFPEAERYPASEAWGTHGFTYHHTQLETARARYTSLVKAGSEAARR